MPGGNAKDFDDLVAFLGNYGLFQIIMIVLLSVSAMPSGYMGMIAVFVSDTPQHHCRVSANSTFNGSWVGDDSCSRYSVNRTEASLSNETEPCADGWVFSTEMYTDTIVSEWGLVCGDAWKVPFSTSAFFIGVLLGAFICGHLSDRFGRKKTLFVTVVLQAVTSLTQAFSTNWVMFCVLNCLRGLGQISGYVVSLVLGSEMLNKTTRVSFTLMGHSMGYGLGYALLPLTAYFIREWRMLMLASAIPSILFIPLWWVIPESPRWLLLKGRMDEADLIIRKAAKWNRVAAPEVIFRTDEFLELTQTKKGEETYTYVDLIRTTNMRNITMLSVFMWMFVAMMFYGLSLNTSNLNGNAYINCFISAVVDIAAYVGLWLLAKKVPQQSLLFGMLMFSGIMLLVTQFIPEDMRVTFQVFALIGKLGVTAGYALIYVIFTEMIPTVVRNMGLGMASTAARVGAIICPYVVYLGVFSKILPYLIFGTISIVAACISMLLPDTGNSQLPDLISQVKPIRRTVCRKRRGMSKDALC